MILKRLLFLLLGLGIFSIKNYAQVTADFSANITSGCGSLAVSFSDLSTTSSGNIVSWNWNLGGVTVTTQQAGRIFPEGSFEICLTVTDNNGNTDTECKTDYIQVYQNPAPDFSVDYSGSCSPLEVTFNDLSTSQGNITNWIWGVGGAVGVIVDDGSLPTIQNTYDIPDEYDISLTITDENGCLGTVTKENFVVVNPDPELEISVDNNFQCTPPFTVNFSNENIESSLEYFWDFGNGDIFSGTNPTAITYETPGSHDVQLIGVNSQTGCSDTLLMEDYISVGYPVDFTFDQTEVCVNEPVNFEDISEVAATSVFWDFGDGITSTDANPTHQFQIAGCHTVILTRIQDGCETTISSDVCIEVKPLPSATFTSNQNASCSVPFDVNFSGVAPLAVSWFWEFGENGSQGTSTEQNPNITFTELGVFPVYLTVTDVEGCSNTVSMDTIRLIELNAALPPWEIRGCSPLSFNLHETSLTPVPITEWYWEIDLPSGMLTSTDSDPTFTVPDTGCYAVKLVVTNALGCIDTSVIENVFCGGMAPIVDFDASPQDACINSDVSFTDLSSPFVNEWFWEFGDSLLSFVQNPTHEYADTGSFDVTLIALHHGCASSLTKENFIHTLAPKAKFSANLDCANPYVLGFKNKSIGADEVLWKFNQDMVTLDSSSLDSITYTFPDTGQYNIIMVAYNFTTNCIDTAVYTHRITEVQANYSLDTTQGCAPLTVNVINNSVFAETYQWKSTNGEISDTTIAEPSITFSDAGVFNNDLQLIIMDENECLDTLEFNQPIQVNGITVDFSANPPFGCNPLPVDFQDNSVSILGNITNWNWEIGNGLLSTTDQNPSYTFDEKGKYPVTLSVEDDWGCTNSIVVDEAVTVTQPLAKFTADTLGCTVSTINFKDQSQGSGLNYMWNFGDGNFSNLKNPTHDFITEGVYTVCLTVTDVNGCSDSVCRDDYIRIANPTANYTSDTTNAACPPLIINFENLSQNASNFEWNFGDGSGNSNLENPPHVYSIPGNFDVTLIAYSNEACRDTLTISNYISLDGPEGQFTLEYDDPCIPTEVTFFAESNDFYTYIWDFGDGILDTSGYRITDTVTHLYTQDFDITPNLILVDDQGCSRAIPPMDTIELIFLESNFEASLTAFCNNNTPTFFTNLTTSASPIENVEWIFEGGVPATSTEMSPEVMYNTSGEFDVTLIVDNGSCRDTMIKSDYIQVGEMPLVAFDLSASEGCAPLSVTFTDNSSVAPGFIEKWDWDFGSEAFSAEQNPTEIFTTDGVHIIQLKATTNIGCQDSITQMLTVHPEVLISISEDTTMCTGESANLVASILGDTTGVTYYWQPDPTLSCTDCLNPTVNPTDTTTYTFVATSPENCSYEKTVTVNARHHAIPVVSISQDTTICAGDVTQIQASGGDNLFGYQWDDSAIGLTCYNACVNPIAQPLSNTTYTVTVTNTSGCSSTASSTVSVFHEFQNLLGEDRTICKGDTVHLQTLNGNNPKWINSNGLSCSVCPNPIASPLQTTTYIVEVTSNFGCEIYDSITINILTEEDIDAGEDFEICGGSEAQLTGFGEGIPSWTPATTLNQTDIFNPIANPDTTTMYYFSLEKGDCILTDSVAVYVLEKTKIDLLDSYICLGESTVLQPIGFADSYQWSEDESLSNTDIKNPIAKPTEVTEYTVIAQLGTCIPDTASAIVEVLENPTVSIPLLYRFFPEDPVLLNVEELSADSDYAYQWTPGIGLSCTDCPNPTANLTESQDYLVIITDLLTGCSTTKKVRVQLVDECSEELISMPNAFSPNNDGENDTYQIYTGIIDEINYFRVFNRWGALVYETDDRYFVWNGKSDGKELEEGVYIFVLEGKCSLNGSTILKQGDITIHR